MSQFNLTVKPYGDGHGVFRGDEQAPLFIAVQSQSATANDLLAVVGAYNQMIQRGGAPQPATPVPAPTPTLQPAVQPQQPPAVPSEVTSALQQAALLQQQQAMQAQHQMLQDQAKPKPRPHLQAVPTVSAPDEPVLGKSWSSLVETNEGIILRQNPYKVLGTHVNDTFEPAGPLSGQDYMDLGAHFYGPPTP